MSEHEGGLVQKAFTASNNTSVVSGGHGINPPGVSQWPLRPILRLGKRQGREDGHRAFLSQPLPASPKCRPGLPMSLYTPGSSLFADRHAGKFTIAQTLTRHNEGFTKAADALSLCECHYFSVSRQMKSLLVCRLTTENDP